jgi:hypothetical protein
VSPPPETLIDRAIREEGERLRKAFPWLTSVGRVALARR